METEDMVSCILRLRDLVMGPILVIETPEAVVVVFEAAACEWPPLKKLGMSW